MLSLGFSLALVVGVVVALVVLLVGAPVISLDRWNEGLHDSADHGSSLFDFGSSDSSDSSSDGSSGD